MNEIITINCLNDITKPTARHKNNKKHYYNDDDDYDDNKSCHYVNEIGNNENYQRQKKK